MGGIMMGLLLAEIGLRISGIRPERFPHPGWQVQYEGVFRNSNIWGEGLIKRTSRYKDLGVRMGEYVPGAVFKCVYPSNPRGYFDADNGVIMSVDRWGMRRRAEDTEQAKPAGTTRILLLGDSFAFGVGVRDEDTFARRIEARLAATAGRRVEVLNAGVQGYNTHDEVVYLEKEWLAFEPDIVLVVFYLNDAYDDSAILNNGEALGIYYEQPGGLLKVSRLWDLIQHKFQQRRTSKAIEQFYHQRYFAEASEFLENPGSTRVDWTACKQALAHAADLSRQRGFKLGVVIFPELYHLDARHPFADVYALVERSCADLGIPTLNLFKTTFRGRDPRELWVHPTDHHPNEIAHRVAADAIAVFLTRPANKLVEPVRLE
jgi:lysophospholipase L1-like esterase